jgi:UDP-glucose 4-epimerase
VTGGAGFIGSHLVDALIARGDEVRVLDNLSTGKRENLAQHEAQTRLVFEVGSIIDGAAVRALTAGCDIVFHLAAAIGVRYVIDDPLSGMLTNVRGTEEVLSAACDAGARVVLASSSEVYGKGNAGDAWQPFREDSDSVIGPTSVPRWWYSLSKSLDEHLAFAYHRQRGLPVSAVRYFNIYGPRCDPGGYGVLARFVSRALRGDPLTVYGDGMQTRSFTYVSDAVSATLLASELDGAVGEAFNVGSSREISIIDAAGQVLSLTGSRSEIQYQKYIDVFGPRFEDTRRRVPDVRKAAEVLGFNASVPLREGLAMTADWWRSKIGSKIGVQP